jgi:hypothetical protein
MKKSGSTGNGKNNPVAIAALVVLIAGLLGVVYYLLSSMGILSVRVDTPQNTDQQATGPTPTLTPRPLPQGAQVYNMSHGPNAKGPKISEVTIDPFDPKMGQKQTITVKIRHDSPVTSAKARLDSDNKKTEYTLNKIEGSDTDGVWQASWDTNDTHDYTYYLFFDLMSATGEFKGGLTFR